MRFRLNVESENAAMVDDAAGEVARMLREVATRVEDGAEAGALLDSNGNRVGGWRLGDE